MWLLNAETRQLERVGATTPKYAILSHRWGNEGEEVTFEDIKHGDHAKYTALPGYYKIEKTCDKAMTEGLTHAWIDSCCIDKSSSAELSEAINSMYRWYEEAAICYAYLSDVNAGTQPQTSQTTATAAANVGRQRASSGSGKGFSDSEWFHRGWTLQELLAPRRLRFYDASWNFLGTKNSLSKDIEVCTRIPPDALRTFRPNDYSIATRMSWAAGRETTRIEDRAYSLMGIFDVNMPLIYGEGPKAFMRLQEEIMKSSDDMSIFAWSGTSTASFGMLADTPDCFKMSETIMPMGVATSQGPSPRGNYTLSKSGVTGSFQIWHYVLNIYIAAVGLCRTMNHDRHGNLVMRVICIFLQEVDNHKFRRVNLAGEAYAALRLDQIDPRLDYGVREIDIVRCPGIKQRMSKVPIDLFDEMLDKMIASDVLPAKPGILFGDYDRDSGQESSWMAAHESDDRGLLRVHFESGLPAVHGCIFLGSDDIGFVVWFYQRTLRNGVRVPAVFISRTIPSSERHGEKRYKHHVCCEAGCVKLLTRTSAPSGFQNKAARLAYHTGRRLTSAESLLRHRWDPGRIQGLHHNSKRFDISDFIEIHFDKDETSVLCYLNDKELTLPKRLPGPIWIFDFVGK